MPRVLKEIPIKERQIVCPHCGRTIAYVANDIHIYRGTDISGGPNEWIICPGDKCGKDITIRSW
jgi:hypothetical protein